MRTAADDAIRMTVGPWPLMESLIGGLEHATGRSASLEGQLA